MPLTDYERAAVELGRRLGTLRRHAGFTQLDLKARIALARSEIDTIEDGLHPIDLYELHRWAEACGHRVQVTLVPEGAPGEAAEPLVPPPTPDELRHLAALRTLPSQARAAIVEVADLHAARLRGD